MSSCLFQVNYPLAIFLFLIIGGRGRVYIEGMDECINERQMQSKRGEGEDEVSLKKQNIDINNMHEGDIDMMPRLSYAYVMGEGEC